MTTGRINQVGHGDAALSTDGVRSERHHHTLQVGRVPYMLRGIRSLELPLVMCI